MLNLSRLFSGYKHKTFQSQSSKKYVGNCCKKKIWIFEMLNYSFCCGINFEFSYCIG